jgi:AcrR family transcriptional regulator
MDRTAYPLVLINTVPYCDTIIQRGHFARLFWGTPGGLQPCRAAVQYSTVPLPLTPKTSKEARQLSAEQWLDAAFHVLARNGVEAVRVEPLAKTLNVTKGSFYWHFKDRSALLDGMLLSWRQRATLGIIDRLERGNVPPVMRLRQLLAMLRINSSSSRDGADVEAAIRLWGRSDAKAASAVQEIDRLRLGYIRSLVQATNPDTQQAEAWSMLIYAFMLAEAAVGPALSAEMCAQCEAILLQGSTGEALSTSESPSAAAAPRRARAVKK